MRRAVVAVPPVRDFYRTVHRHSALGPRIVIKILDDAGWDASFFNFPVQAKKGKLLSLPPEINYLSSFIIPDEKGPLSFFTRFQHFGPTFEECSNLILESDPHIIFLSCFAFCYGEETLKLAEAIHCKIQDVPIAVGGAGASAHPSYFLNNPSVSIVFSGEIEETLPRFIKLFCREKSDCSLLSSIPGVHTASSTYPSENSGHLPKSFSPSWAIVEETPALCSISLSVARGCPKACKFCSVHLSQGGSFRPASVHAVEEMLSCLPTQKKIRCNFEDDNLLCDPPYFFSLLDQLISRFPGIAFTAENGLDYTLLTPSMLEKLIKSGFRKFNLSLGSVSSRILSGQNRIHDLDLYEELLAILDKYQVPSVTYFICGLENDTRENTSEALLYLAEKKTLIGISLFYPVPGIHGFPAPDFPNTVSPRTAASSSAYPWNKSLSTGQMVTAFRLARFINLVKKPVHSRTEKLLMEKTLSSRRIHTLYRNSGGGEAVVPVENLDEVLLESVLAELERIYKPS